MNPAPTIASLESMSARGASRFWSAGCWAGRKARPRADAIRKRRDAGPCALSFAQSRLWLAERINPVPGQYNISRTYRIAGPLDVDALRAAFDALVGRHEVLRTRFVLRDGLPQQVVAPARALRVASS